MSIKYSCICRCCQTNLTTTKHTVNIFSEKSIKEGIREAINAFGNMNVMEKDIGVVPTIICQPCYNLVTSIVKKVDNFRVLCRKHLPLFTVEAMRKRTNEQRSPLQAILSPSLLSDRFARKRLREGYSPVARHRLFSVHHESLPKASNDVPLIPDILEENEFVSSDQGQCNENLKSKGYDILKNSGLRNPQLKTIDAYKQLDNKQIIRLTSTTQRGIPTEISKEIMSIPVVKASVKYDLLKKLDSQCQQLCVKNCGNKEASVLLVPSKDTQDALEHFRWDKIIQEMKDKTPFLLDVMATVSTPIMKEKGGQLPSLCMAYGVMMNGRWKQLSLIQKVVTMILGIGHATNKTFQRLNVLGISQTRATYRNMLDNMGASSVKHGRKMIKNNHEMRVIFDNFDFKVLKNIILKGNKNSDMHWITQFVTFDRVPSTNLDDSKPIVPNIKNFENKNYLPSKSELQKLREEYIVLVSRVLVTYFPCLKPIKGTVAKHIIHEYSEEMSKPSTIINLPVVPYNQNKLGDVCQYLETLTQFLVKVFKVDDLPSLPENSPPIDFSNYASEVLKCHSVPLAGDLLGRERVTGAKRTRAGCDNRTDRFEHIVEVPAVWHAKQSFLCYTWEQLYNTSSARDVGTLYHLRQKLRKTNVCSDVKKNYKAAA